MTDAPSDVAVAAADCSQAGQASAPGQEAPERRRVLGNIPQRKPPLTTEERREILARIEQQQVDALMAVATRDNAAAHATVAAMRAATAERNRPPEEDATETTQPELPEGDTGVVLTAEVPPVARRVHFAEAQVVDDTLPDEGFAEPRAFRGTRRQRDFDPYNDHGDPDDLRMVRQNAFRHQGPNQGPNHGFKPPRKTERVNSHLSRVGLETPKPPRRWIETQHLFGEDGLCIRCQQSERTFAECGGR